MDRREAFKGFLLYPFTLLKEKPEKPTKSLLIENCEINGKEIVIPGGEQGVEHVLIRHSMITLK